MATTIDTAFIRASTGTKVAQYLRHALEISSDELITQELLQAVERGSVPPLVFTIWLGISRSPLAIKQALTQNISVKIRKVGIRRLRKELNSQPWEEVWDGLGGTAGFLDIFSDLSVHEVRAMCVVVGSFSKGQDMERKRERVTELLTALIPRSFPDATYQISDKRPVGDYYQNLVPGCSAPMVKRILMKEVPGEWENVKERHLFKYHSETLRDLTLQTIIPQSIHCPSWLPSLLDQYDPAPGSEPELSISMQFSFNVLRMLAKKPSSTIPSRSYLGYVVEPLIRQTLRKRASLPCLINIIELALEYMYQHPTAADGFSRILVEPIMVQAQKQDDSWPQQRKIIDLVYRYVDKQPNAAKELRRFLQLVGGCLSRHPEIEPQFKALLCHNHKGNKFQEIGSFLRLLYSASSSTRYTLLRFCCKTVLQRDIDNVDDLKRIGGVVPINLFNVLETEDALSLLKRLRKARGDYNLVDSGHYSSSARMPLEYGGFGGDPEIIQILLMVRLGQIQEAEVLAEPQIQARKKRAMASSDQSQRAFYARSVLNYAAASGSTRLFKDVILWARRFVRDPLTISSLYEMYTDEAKSILSGIPLKIAEDLSISALHESIKEANSILEILFETACSALREPSFNPNHWNRTFLLFSHVTQSRMRRSKQLKETCGFADDDIYEAIWDNTLNQLIRLEEEGLKPGHERLGINTLSGILGSWGYSEVKNQLPSTYRFMDNLAKRRDELWRKFRPTIHPAAATLPEPYPRGLPIQHLTADFRIESPYMEAHTPYIFSRVYSALFPDPEAALIPYPKDEESQAAIGHFIDDYNFAIATFIPERLSNEEKKRRIDRAWAYAIGPLSESRMSKDEAVRYWQNEGAGKFPQETSASFRVSEWPTIPVVDDPSQVEEWNPMPPRESKDIEVRRLGELSYIDLSRRISRSSGSKIDSRLDYFTPEIPGQRHGEAGIWHWARFERAKKVPAIREGYILLSHLLLDAQNPGTHRILSTPFPSKLDVRYPALYLDDQALLKRDYSSSGALTALEAHLEDIPLELFTQLTNNTMRALDAADTGKSEYINLESTAFRLIKLLAKSDRPGLATKLAVRTIIDRPDASSWHRQLLAPSIFRRLSATDARACFSSFATAIVTKLEEQAQAKKAAQERAREAEKDETSDTTETKPAPQPYVKVTTVKLLAQLLRDTEFVSEDFSIDILTTLSQKASHADIKQAVVDSLLNMLKTSPPELSAKILASLESIIPMSGKLNERQPISEETWAAALNNPDGPAPPEVELSKEENVPMLTTLLEFLSDAAVSSSNFQYRREYWNRIILPLVENLKREMSKWLRIFLASVEAPSDLLEHLPIVPRNTEVWKTLLRENAELCTLSMLEEYVNYLIFSIKPHPSAIEINKRLNADPALRSKPASQIWLRLYGSGTGALNRGAHFTLPWLLGRTTALDEGGITDKPVQELFLKLFTATLWSDTPRYFYIDKLTKELWPGKFTKRWLELEKPLVEAMVLYVENLKTRDWERDPKRQPSVLPDTFPLRLWLLKYPKTEGLGGDGESKCKAYAEQVSKLIDQITGSLYHKKLAQIKDSFKFLHGMDKVLVALYLGDVKKTRLSWLTMQDVLRVELASGLINDVQVNNNAALEERVAELLKSWKESENEEVRRMGHLTK